MKYEDFKYEVRIIDGVRNTCSVTEAFDKLEGKVAIKLALEAARRVEHLVLRPCYKDDINVRQALNLAEIAVVETSEEIMKKAEYFMEGADRLFSRASIVGAGIAYYAALSVRDLMMAIIIDCAKRLKREKEVKFYNDSEKALQNCEAADAVCDAIFAEEGGYWYTIPVYVHVPFK